MIINELLKENPQVGDAIDLECGDVLIETVIEDITEDGIVVKLDETAMRLMMESRKQYIAESRKGVAEGHWGWDDPQYEKPKRERNPDWDREHEQGMDKPKPNLRPSQDVIDAEKKAAEIRQAELQRTMKALARMRGDVEEGRVSQLPTRGADYSKYDTDHLELLLRPGILHRNELGFKKLIRKELERRRQEQPVNPKDLVVSLSDVPVKKPRGHKQYDPAKEFPGVKAFKKSNVNEGLSLNDLSWIGSLIPSFIDRIIRVGSKETKQTLLLGKILTKWFGTGELTPEEENFAKEQLIDIAKMLAAYALASIPLGSSSAHAAAAAASQISSLASHGAKDLGLEALAVILAKNFKFDFLKKIMHSLETTSGKEYSDQEKQMKTKSPDELDKYVDREFQKARSGFSGMTENMDEAEYQGRKVQLGKPMAGDVKKSKVYVKGPKGNVVKVNFGDKNMRIKKSNPSRRKSFRARHNCDNPGPRWKARYWSCRAW